MYEIKRYTRKFDTDNENDMSEYEGILNDPMCSIISQYKEKLKRKTFDDEGKPLEEHDDLYMVTTWEEKKLI